MAKETFERSKPHLNIRPGLQGQITGVNIVNTLGVTTVFEVNTDIEHDPATVYIVSIASPVPPGTTRIAESRLKRACTMVNDDIGGALELLPLVLDRYGNLELGSRVFVGITIVDTESGQKWDYGTFSGLVTGT